MKIIIVLLFSIALWECGKPVPPVSKFQVSEIAYARAAIFGPNTFDVLDDEGNYTPDVLDSVELSGEVARETVTTLLAASNYTLPDYQANPDGYIAYGVLCHNPHFLLQAYDADGHRSNLFTICFSCGNVRMINYRKYPKEDELMMSPDGEAAFMALQDDLFPDYKNTFFWDPIRRLQQ